MTILELNIPYPDFQMYEVIDPEQFDLNNQYIQTKINQVSGVINSLTDSITNGGGASKIAIEPIAPFVSTNVYAFLKEVVTKLQSGTAGASGADFIVSTAIPGVTGTTVQAQLKSLKDLIDVEKNRITALTNRVANNESSIANRYTKAEVDAKDSTLQTQITQQNTQVSAMQTVLTSHNHDTRYMTRSELAPYLQGGDTKVVIEVFTIVTPNNGDGTFMYRFKEQNVLGRLGTNGEQIFKLSEGKYILGMNHIKAIVGDTLHRSVASGGLVEISNTEVALTYPEGPGAEITVEYYERIGVTGEHNIVYGETTPPPTSGSTMWFKVVG